MVIAGSAIALVVLPSLGGVVFALAVVLVVPAASLLAHTVEHRTTMLADAYGQAGGYVSEVLSAIRTVAALGLEEHAITKYDAMLARAERVALRTTAKLALASSTMTAFVFYACGTATMMAFSLIRESMMSSQIPFAPSEEDLSFCVPSACAMPYDTNLLAFSMRFSFDTTVVRNGTCPNGTESFVATCLSGAGLHEMLDLWHLSPNPTKPAFDRAEASWPCSGIKFEYMLIAINTIVFSFLQIASVLDTF